MASMSGIFIDHLATLAAAASHYSGVDKALQSSRDNAPRDALPLGQGPLMLFTLT